MEKQFEHRGRVFTRDDEGDARSEVEIREGLTHTISVARKEKYEPAPYLATVAIYGNADSTGGGGHMSFQTENAPTEIEAIDKAIARAEIGWAELLEVVAVRGGIAR